MNWIDLWFLPIVLSVLLLLPREKALIGNVLLLLSLIAILVASDSVLNNIWSFCVQSVF